jgi:NitT/TauT family transport system permease protein
MRRLAQIAAPIVLLAVLLLLWEDLCRWLNVPVYFLPKPSDVGFALYARWPLLLEGAFNTLGMSLAAFAVALAVGLAIAVLAGLSDLFARAVRPIAVTLQATPVIAIAPLVLTWFGLDHAQAAVVALAAVVAFFPIFSGALTGLSSADPDLERLFDLYGASRAARLWKLRAPSAVPFLLEGCKIGLSLSVIGAVVAEFVAGSGQTKGLAWRILEAQNRLRIADMIAAVLVLALLAVSLNFLIGLLEKQAMRRWRGRPR